jgi:hypothetical protein
MQLLQYFKRPAPDLPVGNVPVILVQCVEDSYYYGLFGQIIRSLRLKHDYRVEQFVLRSLRIQGPNFFQSKFIAWILGRKWIKLYDSFCQQVAYRSTGFLHPIGDLVDFVHARSLWQGLTDKSALIAMKIQNIPVGDLINDSYLRCRPAPTVDLKDRFLLRVIWQSFRDIRRATSYFAKVKPSLFLTSYCTYVQHGVAVRVALKNGVNVFSFGSYQEFSKELSCENWFHTRNTNGYFAEFQSLPDQEQKIAAATAALNERISGKIDRATAYMAKSAYSDTGASVPDVKNAVIIFLHDFFDSPHIFRAMLFPDFWEWICHTIEILDKASIRFFLKPHPNQIDMSSRVLADLISKYPDASVLPVSITNKQLAEAEIKCAVTVYGTVAHEMAFLGIPTIACGDHPHSSFNFCQTAASINEYSEMLRNCNAIRIDPSELRRQSAIFYYMHNLNLTEDEFTLMTAMIALHTSRETPELPAPTSALQLQKMAALPAFESHICAWERLIHESIGGNDAIHDH